MGDYKRQNKNEEEVQKFIKEIQSISSKPIKDHFFNVADEVALLTIVDALGSRIFALEGVSATQSLGEDVLCIEPQRDKGKGGALLAS